MITINLKQRCVRDSEGISVFYLLGLERPHYPVPAVIVASGIFPDYVTFNRYNGNVGMYGPGYESVHTIDKKKSVRYNARDYPL